MFLAFLIITYICFNLPYILAQPYCSFHPPFFPLVLFSVLAYDVGTQTWFKTKASMRRFLRSSNLVECKVNLLLVAAVEKSNLNVPEFKG
ncbi:transmembrane protein, putative [Medicago truncatula]|uniref:Transmembrane protein, putative n=1 Tax=Medicago truncatula TaxID=3880 RepID=G7KKF2_MEDTR|nr:transmembrane protein, putative [Medicago truncatula]